jgi:DNA-binding IclR family transcriptional regulator
MLKYGSLVLDNFTLKIVAIRYINELWEKFDETVHLASLDDDNSVIYLEKLSSRKAIVVMSSRVGSTAPVYCTGVGKVILANLPRGRRVNIVDKLKLVKYTENTICDKRELIQELSKIQSQGFAIDNMEHEENVRCVAAPVFNHQGEVLGAVSVSAPFNRLPDVLEGSVYSKAVTKTCREISDELGYDPARE